MAVLWEVQTFKKPWEGQDHLWATTYVLNLSVELAKITPLHYIRGLPQKSKTLVGGLAGPLAAPDHPRHCVSCTD